MVVFFCNLPEVVLGFAIVAGLVAMMAWFIRTGWAWGGRMLGGGVYRAENPAGFWTAIVQYVALAVVILAMVWIGPLSTCLKPFHTQVRIATQGRQ